MTTSEFTSSPEPSATSPAVTAPEWPGRKAAVPARLAVVRG